MEKKLRMNGLILLCLFGMMPLIYTELFHDIVNIKTLPKFYGSKQLIYDTLVLAIKKMHFNEL